MQPPAHDCSKPLKVQKRGSACKRCFAGGLCWHRCPLTMPAGGWKLYQAKANPTGAGYVADTQAPHLCPNANRPLSPVQQAIAPDTPEDREPEAEDVDQADAPQAPPARAAGPLETLIAAAVAPYVKGSVDEAKVRAIVAEALAERAPEPVETVIVLQRPDGARVETKDEHPLFPTLTQLLAAGTHVYAWGPPGGGKSTAAAHAARALGRRYGYISLNPQTTDSRLLGYKDATGNYHRTPFRDCYEGGGVFCIDEMDNASDNLLTTLNGALENGHGAFPDGLVDRHADFVMVATGNTAGRGGSQNHAGRRPFDAATAERFVYLAWNYDEALEERLTLAAWAGARPWLAWVRKVRAYAGQHHPRLVVSPRASILGARLLKSGVLADVDAVAEAVLFKGLDRDTRAKIVAACPLPTVRTEAA